MNVCMASWNRWMAFFLTLVVSCCVICMGLVETYGTSPMPIGTCPLRSTYDACSHRVRLVYQQIVNHYVCLYLVSFSLSEMDPRFAKTDKQPTKSFEALDIIRSHIPIPLSFSFYNLQSLGADTCGAGSI